MTERPNQKDHEDQKIHKRIDQPKAVVVPPLGQHNHNDWRHTQSVRPQERQNHHVITPQIDPRRLNLSPSDLRQRRAEQFQYGNPRQYHNRHFQNPYDGMNNFWRDSWQDNYYNDRHHHRDRDDFIPRVLEGILGGLLSGSLVRELDRLNVDGNQTDEAEDFDDNDRFDRAFKEDKSPDRQVSINLDFSPQTSGFETRFERTG